MRRLWVIAIFLLWPAQLPAQTTRVWFNPTTEPPNTAARWSRMFPRDPSGFTLFSLGDGARIIEVSSTDGSDFNDGQFKPVRTLKKALSLVSNGYPDRILFKRGDVFRAANLNANVDADGRDFAEPLIIGAYGSDKIPRPVLEGHLYFGGHFEPRFVVIQSLDFYANTRDPSVPGFKSAQTSHQQEAAISVIAAGEYMWIEDCRFRDYGTALIMQAPEGRLFDTLIVRRCQVLDSWDFGHSEGIYLDNFQNVLIEENLFDHNGWIDHVPGAGKTIFNHNMYIQKSKLGEERHIIIRQNISARASSHGCQLRPGGLLEDNLFLKNPLAAFVGVSESLVRNNVVLDADSISAGEPRGQGLQVLNCGSVLAVGNIVAHKPSKLDNMEAFSFTPIGSGQNPNQTRGEFRQNIVYEWAGTAFNADATSAGMNVHDNCFEQLDDPVAALTELRADYFFRNNHYSSQLSKPFRIGGKAMDLNEWMSRTGETASTKKVYFVDPSRDIVSYGKSIGLADPTLEGFLAAARGQQRGHWDQKLTAEAVNDYIRAGFARKGQ